MFPRNFLRLPRVVFALAVMLAAIALAPSGWAYPPNIKLEVRSVQFNLVPPAGANARWLEADIEVETKITGLRTRFVDRVRVGLSLGTKVPGGTYRYYQAETEVVAVEEGVAHFRFYLPAEIVKRDGLGGEPEFWSVQIIADGEPQPATLRNISSSLRMPARQREFEGKIAAEAPAYDGELQPQHLTPFANQYPLSTPTPVRRYR